MNRYIVVRVLHRESGRILREENFLTDSPFSDLTEAMQRVANSITATAMTYVQPGERGDRLNAHFQIDISNSAEV